MTDSSAFATDGGAAADIRRWCDHSKIPGRHPDLSDAASILIASGFLSDSARAVLVRRATAGMPIPAIGGFGDLRRLHRELDQLDDYLRNPRMPRVGAMVLRSRIMTLTRRRETARNLVTASKPVFAGTVRGIRRERRDGLYLDIPDRERLFNALLFTPTPNSLDSGYLRRAGAMAANTAAGVIGQLTDGRSRAGQWVAEKAAIIEGPDDDSSSSAGFVDGYETLLYVAGSAYDRIVRSPVWRSDHFSAQRTQINLHAELAEISADVINLRTVRIELDRVRVVAASDERLGEQLRSREAELRPVWSQLIARVAALADVADAVAAAAHELRILEQVNYAGTIDHRIDQLIGRSGERELSAENTRRLSEQLGMGRTHLRDYRNILQGNVTGVLGSAYEEPVLPAPSRAITNPRLRKETDS
ncbi:hypothetical protein DFJ75_4527 [Williamsia muralis]|uniref:Uncharacterized protein n=1 Tax=Williamsia marianensis TaxID=85044 RepID=A0A495KAG4_WILMA|nr:hypothetical protein [Williamsia muralis]RKR97638.1 hypothetical protein DFJ75_4527 [Williamsia muralis]